MTEMCWKWPRISLFFRFLNWNSLSFVAFSNFRMNKKRRSWQNEQPHKIELLFLSFSRSVSRFTRSFDYLFGCRKSNGIFSSSFLFHSLATHDILSFCYFTLDSSVSRKRNMKKKKMKFRRKQPKKWTNSQKGQQHFDIILLDLRKETRIEIRIFDKKVPSKPRPNGFCIVVMNTNHDDLPKWMRKETVKMYSNIKLKTEEKKRKKLKWRISSSFFGAASFFNDFFLLFFYFWRFTTY